MRRIFLVTQQFMGTTVGGEGVHAIELARELIKNNINVTVLTMGLKNQPHFETIVLEDRYEKIPIRRKIRIPTYRFFSYDSAYLNSPYHGDMWTNVRRAKEFRHQVLGFLRAQPDQDRSIVHLHGHYMIPALAKEIKLYTKFRIISSIHRAESLLQKLGLNISRDQFEYQQAREKEALDFSDRVIVRSQYIKDFLTELYQHKIRKGLIEVVTSAVSEGFIHAPSPSGENLNRLKTKYAVKGDLILTLSIFEPVKGLDVALNAIPLLLKKMRRMTRQQNPEFTYIIAGRLTENHRWYYNKLVKLLKRPSFGPVRSKIRIIPNVDEETKRDLYDLATVFLYTPITEPFGIVLAEALAKKSIVITTDSDGPRLVLNCKEPPRPPFTACQAGLIVPNDISRRHEFVAEAAAQALTHKPDYARMVQYGCQHALKHLSWDSLVRKIIEIYKSTIKNKRREQ